MIPEGIERSAGGCRFLDFSGVPGWADVYAGFTIRHSRPADISDDNITAPAGGGCREVIRPLQAHTARIAEFTAGGAVPQACDAVFSRDPNIILTISVSDCLPVYLHHPGERVVGLVHAGWRGIAAGICEKSVHAMLCGSEGRPAEMEAILGPAIGPCCMEVTEEVAVLFPRSAFSFRGDGGIHLDLAGEARRRLKGCGLIAENISSFGECTACHPERYHSFRRDGVSAGRMIAFLGLK